VDLDDELRRLFQDDRLEIQVRPGADEAVVTGARRVRRRRIALASAGSTFAVAAIVAGGIALSGIGGPTSLPPADTNVVGTTSTPAGSTSAAAPQAPQTVVSTVIQTVTVPAGTGQPPGNNMPNGPVGYGKLKLGMTEADAVATGGLKPGPEDALGCHTFFTETYPDMVGAVVIAPKSGVVRITLPSSGKTSAGVGAGSTVAEIKAKYPNANESRNGLTVPMSGTPSWYYVFAVDGSGGLFTGTEKVVRVRMEQVSNECNLA
jgi:hypothetical protein